MVMYKGFYKANNLTRQISYKSKQELNKMLVLEALESLEKYQRAKGGELGRVTASRREIGNIISNRQINGNTLTDREIRTGIKKLLDDGHIVLIGDSNKKTNIYVLTSFFGDNDQEKHTNYNAYNNMKDQKRTDTEKRPSERPKSDQEEYSKIKDLNSTNDQETTKQTTNNNKNNNKNNNIVQNNTDLDISEIWKTYPNKKGKQKSITKIKGLLKKYSKQDILNAIRKYKKYVDDTRQNDFNLSYQNGSTFFNSGIYDYLGEEVEENADNKKTCGNKELTQEEKIQLLQRI